MPRLKKCEMSTLVIPLSKKNQKNFSCDFMQLLEIFNFLVLDPCQNWPFFPYKSCCFWCFYLILPKHIYVKFANFLRGVSWNRVTRFSILDFLIGFPNFSKLSPKMLYLGPIYPRKVGLFVILNFLTPLPKLKNIPRFNETITINNIFWPANWDPKRQFWDPKYEKLGPKTANLGPESFLSKIYPLKLKISSIVRSKTCEIGWKSDVDFSRFHTFFGLQLKISRAPVLRLWYKIAFWKRYELQIIWFKFRHKVCWTSLSNLVPKLKFPENWKS